MKKEILTNENTKDKLKEIHQKFSEMEEKVRKKGKWTNKEFVLIQGRINSLFELISKDEIFFIENNDDLNKILTNKIFYDYRFNLIKLNIDLLSKVIKQDEEIETNIEIDKLLKNFKF